VATETFQVLCKHTAPDLYIFTSLINAYRQSNRPDLVPPLFQLMKQYHVSPTIKIFGALIAASLEAKLPHKALEFGKLITHHHLAPDPHIYCLLLRACADLCFLEGGKHLHHAMENSLVKRDKHTEASLINMYGKCGCPKIALEVFGGCTNSKFLQMWWYGVLSLMP
jgi:pentatricopeptide repeat protein